MAGHFGRGPEAVDDDPILGPEIGILGWSSHYLPFAEGDAKKRKEDS
jgi:hypothetical protein